MKKLLVGLLLTISLISYGTTKIQKDFERKLENLKSEKGNKSGKLYEDFGIFIDDGILLDVLTDGHKKMTYKINSAKVEGDTAVINLDMKSPNLSYYFPEFIKKVYELIFADPENIKEDDEEFVNNFFKEKLNLKDLKYSKKNINVYLRKEGNDWLVDEEESKNDDFNEMITLGLLKLDDGLIWGFPENDEE
ncbi:MAG: hypothetical protein KA080_00330 [Leptotrichiaceae bacterium]|nr:hypothetical protein [Leptotrichiaceae bacterium]MBP9630064.1 hypothetical protein [Leptotrichiaceae bacterium]